jgi:hypothetical protein
MQSIETCSVPNEKNREARRARRAGRKKLEKQTTGQVGVEAAILEQKNVLKWRRPCKNTSQ